MKSVEDRLCAIKMVVSSVSGVLHNNQDIIGLLDGHLFQGFARSHYDGQGISLLRAIGIKVAFVDTDFKGSTDLISRMLDRWNHLPSAQLSKAEGGWPLIKLIHREGCVGEAQIPPVEAWLKEVGLTFADCAVMGHDLVQIPLMRAAKAGGAFIVVPAQAEKVAWAMADYVTVRPGGNGALRDFVNAIIEARGIDPTTLPTR